MTTVSDQVLTPFSTLMASMQQDGVDHTIHLPPDWLQGRTAYGGLSASICLEAAHRSQPDLPPLRSAQFCFVGPATGTLCVKVQELRRGKSTVLLGADLYGDDGLAVRATLCFGKARASAVHHNGLTMPEVEGPDAYPAYFTWAHRPNFMRHFEGRLVKGERPGAQGRDPAMTVWLRHEDPEPSQNLSKLLALADALPPAAKILLTGVVPISTMTWSVEVLQDAPASDSGWWLVQAHADTSMDGYSAQQTVIWGLDGRPAIVARQNVVIFG